MRMILWLIFLFAGSILVLNLRGLHAVVDWIFTSFQRPSMAIFVALSFFLFFYAAGQLAKNRQMVVVVSVPAIAFGIFEFFQSGPSGGGNAIVAMMALFFSVATIVAQIRSDEPR